MDTKQQLKEWMKKMEISINIPESELPKICNRSTELIWQQVINKIKPKSEVEFVRNQILINRMKRKNWDKSSNYCDAHHKLQLVKKKNGLVKEAAKLSEQIRENEMRAENLHASNSVKYVQLESVKSKRKESEQKIFLLDNKMELIKKDVVEVEEVLNNVTNLTPVEEEPDSTNRSDVMETLKQTAAKIEKLIQKRKVGLAAKKNQSIFSSIRKPYRSSNKSASEMILNLTSRSCNQTLNYLNPRCQSTPFRTPKQDQTLGIIYDLSICDETSMIDCFSTPKTHDARLLNPEFEEEIKTIVIKNNRRTIWECVETMCDELKADFARTFFSGNIGPQITKMNVEDFAPKFHEAYLRNIFVVMRLEKNIKSITEQIRNEQLQVNALLDAQLKQFQGECEGVHRMLELQKENVVLTATLSFLQKEAKLPSPDVTHELKQAEDEKFHLLNKLKETKDQIDTKVSRIKELHVGTHETIESTWMVVSKLKAFAQHTDWLQELTQELPSLEIRVFSEYPLSYDKSSKETVQLESLFSDSNLDPNTIYMLTKLLRCPAHLPETILLNIALTKIKLAAFKALPDIKLNHNYKKLNLDELKSKEQNLNKVMEKLQKIVQSNGCIVSRLNQIKELLRLWLEMPVKNVIPSTILHKQKTYEHYKHLYMDSYNCL